MAHPQKFGLGLGGGGGGLADDEGGFEEDGFDRSRSLDGGQELGDEVAADGGFSVAEGGESGAGELGGGDVVEADDAEIVRHS